MKFDNLKIGGKIVTGFSIISVIAIVIGITGMIGIKNVGDLLNTVSDVRLPGVEHLGDMESNLERIHKGYIKLTDPKLERNEREQILLDISTSREKYLEAQEAFGNLKQTAEEEEIYNQLLKDLEDWQNVNTQQVERLNTRFIETGLLDPVNLMRNVEKFKKEHYLLQKKVLDALHNDAMFEGGGDPEACEFSQWMSEFRTENSEIRSYIREMRDPHKEFHSAVETIKALIGQGATGEAIAHYHDEMQPAAEEFLNYLDLIGHEAERGNDIFNQMSHAINVESTEYHSGVMEDISQLISINRRMANEDDNRGDTIYQASNLMILLVILIGMAIGVILSYVITRSITGGVSKGVKMAEDIANGDLTQEVDKKFLEKKDEVGQLARALQHMSEQLRKIIGEVMGSADNITSASQEMSSTSQQVSQGTSEQASSAEEVSSSMEEMVSNIQQNTDSAMETEKIAIQAAQGIRKGSESSNETAKSMKDIASKVSIISDIAYQTNILALNAAVEAARAGEYGEGFAVVAEEVRKLAEKSQVAAEEINELSGGGVDIAVETGQKLETIVPEIEKTSKLVQEIAAGSKEQNAGADQINSAIQQLNQVVQQNAAAAEEMSSSSEELAGQAEQMREVVSYFKIDHNRLVSKTQEHKSSVKQTHPSPGGNGNGDGTHQSDGGSTKGVDLEMKPSENSDEDFQRF